MHILKYIIVYFQIHNKEIWAGVFRHLEIDSMSPIYFYSKKLINMECIKN